MFNEQQVCEDFSALRRARSKKSQDAIIGKIVSEIRNSTIAKQGYSPKEVLESVKYINAITQHLKGRKRVDSIKHSVERLNREFRTNLGTWNFIIPVENLKIQPRSFKIGDIKFFKFSPHKRKERRTRLWRLIKNNPHYNTKWKKNYVKDHEKRILLPIEGKTCAMIQVTGRIDKAQLEAYDKVETAIAVLKLYKSPLYDQHMQYFNITGKVVPNVIRITLRYSEDGKNINPIIAWVGFRHPFELTNQKIQVMKKAGFPKIHKMLKKKEHDKLESRIINTIRLFGSACDIIVSKSSTRTPIALGFPSDSSSTPKTSFVCLFVALESLLIFDENEPLANNIAERAAFLLANNYRNRIRIKNFIKTMYRLRSAYVHHGKSNLDHDTLKIFSDYVQSIVLTLIIRKDRMKLTTEKHLKNWFERKKLT